MFCYTAKICHIWVICSSSGYTVTIHQKACCYVVKTKEIGICVHFSLLTQRDLLDLVLIYGVSQKICYNPGNSTFLFRPLVLFFSECLTRRIINAARIVLFRSTVKLNSFSLDEKRNLQLAG